MRKSPFSTPRGNGHGGSGWKSNGNFGRGYRRSNNFGYHSPNLNKHPSPNTCDDFIPFDNNISPSNDRNFAPNRSSPAYGNWQSAGRAHHQKSTSPAVNNYCNNSGRGAHRWSPYFRNATNNFRGNHKSFPRNAPRKNLNIASYVDLQSFLEDPWSKLLTNVKKNPTVNSSTSKQISGVSSDRRNLATTSLRDAGFHKDSSGSGSLKTASSDLKLTQYSKN